MLKLYKLKLTALLSAFKRFAVLTNAASTRKVYTKGAKASRSVFVSIAVGLDAFLS